MSSKCKLIVCGTFLIMLIIMSLIYFLLPKIEININGNEIVDLQLGEEYIDEGATSYLDKIFKKEKLEIKIDGNINYQKPGKYFITYTSSTKNSKKEKVRIINIIDNIKPEIKIKKDVLGCKNNKLIEYDIEAYDNYDGVITDNIKYNISSDEITFTVFDSSMNKSEVSQKIKYMDQEKPKITLKNEKNIYISIGSNYEEYGAIANDFCDGDLTSNIKIEHNVNTNKEGTYEVNYIVTDSNNNETIEKRFVTVTENFDLDNGYEVVNGATIYLTFDDGPGQYTEKILDVLDEYNVKATFFVTGQFPLYRHLIKEEYERGHTIGIHTYTHKWSIYESVENYLKDFNQIEDVIYQETGTHVNLFRFPGGSSNKISENYKKGIVTELAKLLKEKGYTYYDWTFDSGDTNKNNNSVNAILKNFKKYLKGDGEYIVLMHDIKKNTLVALPKIIKYALDKGYKFDKITDNTPLTQFKIYN